jgi:phage repressor protein C with HTH and peptisase S24 domain
MDDSTQILERLNIGLKTLFLKKGIQRKGDMADYLGYKNPYFSGVINGRERLSDSFLNTLTQKLGINSEWILTGEGSMERAEEKDEVTGFVVPLVPLMAHGGSLTMFAETYNPHECEKLISPISGAEFAITVIGDSMSPEYPSGSIVLIHKVEERSFIEWGKTYVLDTINGIVIKVLVPSTKENHIRCISINKSEIYAPFDVPMEDVYGIYAVRFCMTRK